jgi:sortase (surface protein transpeptidase)
MIKKILSLCLLLSFVFAEPIFFASADFSAYQDVQSYYTQELAKKGIPVIKWGNMDIEIPRYTRPDFRQENLDIAYWISLLPTEYQDENEYFIFPKAGMVVPIVNMTAEERLVLSQGKAIDYLPYLQQGALHHRGKKPFQGPGNFTLAGHTAYYKNDPGHFKTNMQWILLANPWDTLIYATKSWIDSFQRYLYSVEKSYETMPQDVSVLLPSDDSSYELTAYGCSPVGSTEKRWIVKARLFSSEEVGVSIVAPVEEEVVLLHNAADIEQEVVVDIPENAREEIWNQFQRTRNHPFVLSFSTLFRSPKIFFSHLGPKILSFIAWVGERVILSYVFVISA